MTALAQRAPLDIRATLRGGTVRLQPAGELDRATVPALRTALRRHLHRGRDVVLDVSGLTFVDVAGLRCLIVAGHRARDRGVAFRLAGRCPRLERLAAAAGLREVLLALDPDVPRSEPAGITAAWTRSSPASSTTPLSTRGSDRPSTPRTTFRRAS